MSTQEEKFYTYLILDPRHKGTFIYNDGNLTLSYLPIYTGKGSYYRHKDHIREAKNTNKDSDKLNLLREILKDGQEPIIIKVLENVTEKEALSKEIELIWVIGRADLNMGPLTNKTWGGEGGSGWAVEREKLVGRIFGRLLVLEYSDKDNQGINRWLCVCECGNETITRGSTLKGGRSKSCGCLQKEIVGNRLLSHGMTGSPEHNIWRKIKDRLDIIICDRWLESFENFYEDIGERPTDKHILTRIDKKGNFEPSNCHWTTRTENYRQQFDRFLVIDNERKTMKEWAKISGTNKGTVKSRLHRGWSDKEAVFGK